MKVERKDKFSATASNMVVLALILIVCIAALPSSNFNNHDGQTKFMVPTLKMRRMKGEQSSSSSSDGDKKHERNNIDSCSFSFDSSADVDLPPCRIPDIGDVDGEDQYQQFRPEKAPNLMSFEVQLGLPPGSKSSAPLLTNVLVNRLDSSINNMDFHLSGKYEEVAKKIEGGPGGGGNRPREDNQMSGQGGGGSNLFAPGDDGRRKTLEQKYRVRPRRSLMRDMEFDMRHIVTKSKIEKKNSNRWWWKVTLELACFWENDQAPVGQAVINNIHKNMSKAFLDERRPILRELRRALDERSIRLLSWENDLPTEEEDLQYSPIDDGFNETSSDDINENSSPDESDVAQREPLDPGEWDWQTYLGFSVSTFMICFTVVLVLLASRRKRLKEKSLTWGNLGSQEGVEELLTTGWAIKGSQMELYDKQNLGYKDDDSIFLGGFEQKEAVVGTEITITQPESTTTKDLAEFQSSQNASGFSQTSGSRPSGTSK